MTYTNTIQTLQQLAIKKGINYKLEKLIPILEHMGNPHKNLKATIHVAGTNGKGSTVAFLSHIFRNANLKVGTFTSPHLKSYTERLCINHEAVTAETFNNLFTACSDYLNQGLTEFEMLTLMAFKLFSHQQPDICIFEVGLGGRLDATNVCLPTATIITSIDYDHQEFLGHTLPDITAEKSGIIKPNIPIFTTYNQHYSAIKIIKQKAKDAKAPLTIVKPLSGKHELGLNGIHQYINAALAKQCIETCFPKITSEQIKQGLKETSHWGRLSVVQHKNNNIIIDAAHNPASIKALAGYIKKHYPNQNPAILFGFNKTKAWRLMLKELETISTKLIYCFFDKNIATPTEHIQKLTRTPLLHYKINQELPDCPLLIITGSIYFISNFYKNNNKNV